jgi:hypothetical protein
MAPRTIGPFGNEIAFWCGIGVDPMVAMGAEWGKLLGLGNGTEIEAKGNNPKQGKNIGRNHSMGLAKGEHGHE